MEQINFGAAFLGGLISFLSPCVLPLVPGYLCFIAGADLESMLDDEDRDPALYKRTFYAAIFFVLGFSSVFMSLGASASALSRWIAPNLHILGPIAGGLIILFGLHYMHLFRIPFLDREARVQTESRPASIVGAYLVGLAFGFGWTPCVGPILAAILALASSQESIGAGTTMLAIYSAGLGIPFLLAALGMRRFMGFMRRFRKHIGTLEKATGGLLVLTGVLIAMGSLQDLSLES